MHIYHLILLSFILFGNSAVATESGIQQFNSCLEQNSLIELYTSEGCSSCPPAEKYLNSFKENNKLWKKYIPVAFHVDYWDYLGWMDRYAQPQFSKRQSRYAKQRNLKTIYTPAFVVNGQSWRKSMFKQTPPVSNKQTGILQVGLKENQLTAEFKPVNPEIGNLVLNIAVLGIDLSTKIKAGENKGNLAEHEFVVIGFKSISSTTTQWKTSLPKLHYPQANKYGLAVWVNQQGDLSPLQSTGGYINNLTAETQRTPR